MHRLPAAFALLLALATPALAGDIGIHEPYAIQAVPGAPTGAAFMLIHNHGDAPDRLIGAASPVAERVELHTHLEEDGVMRMMHVEEGFEIAADGELRLERGGAHVMFLGVTEPFEDGDVIPLTLTFERTGEMTFDVPVDLDRLAGDASMEHGDPEEMGHDGHMAMEDEGH